MESILVNHSTVKSNLINARGQKYPNIFISEELIVKPSFATDSGLADVFVDEHSFYKQLYRQLSRKGLFSTLESVKSSLAERRRTDNAKFTFALKVLYSIIVTILTLRNIGCLIYFYFYPYEELTNQDVISHFHSNTEWNTGLIRCFAWHPKQCRNAVALGNDLIYVYSADYKRPINHFVILKNALQKNIASLAWHPKRDHILAVACERSVLIWTLQSDLQGYKPTLDSMSEIQTPLLSPLTSVQFHPDGDVLVACSTRCPILFIVRFDWKSKELKYTTQMVRSFFQPQYTHLSWSPDGSRVVAQTTSKKLRIFETEQWSSKTFKSNLTAPCQAVAWSNPKGRYLLYSSRGSSQIFALNFYYSAQGGDIGGTDKSVLLVDMREQMFEDGEVTGVVIQDFIWNRDSTLLVVLFKDKPNVLGIFGTKIKSSIQIWPLCVVRSYFDSIDVSAQIIKFHNSYLDNNGSLLTVCWSNGAVSNLPLTNESIIVETDSPRNLTKMCKSFTTTPTRANGDTSMNRSMNRCANRQVTLDGDNVDATSMGGDSLFTKTTKGDDSLSTMHQSFGDFRSRGSILQSPVAGHRQASLFSTTLKFD